MTPSGPIVAEMLESSAAGYASAASASLSADGSDLPVGWGSPEWKANLRQRILELATAIRVDEPAIFARRILWLRRALVARNAPEADLKTAIESIRNALQRELPENLIGTVDKPITLALAALEGEIESDATILDASTPHGRLGLQYLTACLEARSRDAIDLVLAAVEQGEALEKVYTRVLLPAQREIGQLWHTGDVSVSEERLVSETTRSVMSIIVHRHAPTARHDRTLVSASVSGNAHDIGLRASTDLFALAGWRTIFLGANVPSVEIAQTAQAFKANVALLNATLTTQINAMSDVIGRLRQVSGGTKLLIGGHAFDDARELWKSLGADGFSPDIESVVTIATGLIGDS